jgi:hypothetical protein
MQTNIYWNLSIILQFHIFIQKLPKEKKLSQLNSKFSKKERAQNWSKFTEKIQIQNIKMWF